MMENIAYEKNTIEFEKKYCEGYGVSFPEDHVIRIHKQILEHELGIKNGNILDYGCGIGTHLKYFTDNGFFPFGCDISRTAIEKCKLLLPEFKKNFHVVTNIPNLKNHFKEKFDVILSNQVLYYLNDKDIQNLTRQFSELLTENGIFIATMMLRSAGYYNNHVVSKKGDLSKVVLTGRLNETTYINFKTNEEVIKIFDNFKKSHLGFFGSMIHEEEGSSDHAIFVGMLN